MKATENQAQAKELLSSRERDLNRISKALDAAASAVLDLRLCANDPKYKCNRDPVTAADLMLNQLLLRTLPREDEGWLSEESKDNPSRLRKRRVWVVDPIDGTKEFIQGIPEWCISIGLVEDGQPAAGGVANPSRRGISRVARNRPDRAWKCWSGARSTALEGRTCFGQPQRSQ